MKHITEIVAWFFCTALIGLGAIYAVQVLHGVSTTGDIKYNRVELENVR